MANLPIKVFASPEYVGVSLRFGRKPSVVEVSLVPSESTFTWYINRALCHQRGQGIGSKLLEAAVKACISVHPDFDILVSPGGYHDRIEDQRRFYTNNGFVQSKAHRDLYVYDKTRLQ